MYYIWSLIKYKPFLYILTIVLNMLIGFIPLIEGLVIKEFFDIISGNKISVFYPYQLIILIAVISLIHILLMRIYFVKSSSHNFYISTLLRRNMLNSILKRHGGKAIDSLVGQVINSFRDDVSQIQTSIFWISTLIGQIIRAIGAVVILLFIDVKITLTVFIPLVLIIRLAQKLEKNIEENREEGRKATGAVNGAVGEIFESILSIKVSGAKKDLMNNLKTLNEKRNRAMIKDSMLSQIIDSIYNNIINIGTGVILLLGAGAISKGRFTVGDFSIFVYYLASVTDSVESFGNFMVYFKQTKVGYRNILNQINMKENPENLVKHKNIYLDKYPQEEAHNEKDLGKLSLDNELKTLEIKGLTYLYNQSENGIKDINFTLKKGEVLVISGRTGSGKTTLLKSLIGLLPKGEGEIYWNGERVENAKEFFIPPISAYTSQVPNLFSDTVKNNILLGLSEKDVDLDEAIKASVFEKDLEELDNGLDTVIGTKGAKLSGGQMQRVAAARMFVRKPQLLILDDISSALDVETEKLLWTRLLSDDTVSCIVVSNRSSILEKSDRIIVLKDGSIESQGTLNKLLKSSTEFKEVVS
ncbi:ABC transporter ATP-binding protein [Sporanaerobacter sp. PP17-6a]|uniref:ABC transporter ATP-binding protein n=1 Tax=Sporanaerobacter sp. PP17-6a TaxID=1891289 RepID=UPI00089F9F4A|nr:ABC transporter ATP-binding protein [Sporanaerobacter sp. PP17-6a]SCL83853.1 putative multidrug resistance ABC transporter ATP-binding/permease protein YheI [Sporanaerobacter sp. PP17-6a]